MEQLTYITLAITFGIVIMCLILDKIGKKKAANVAMSLPAVITVLVCVISKLF